jgi:hypothetical protein
MSWPNRLKNAELLRRDARVGQRSEQAQLAEDASGVGEHVDTHAHRTDLGNRFVHGAVDPGVMQLEGEGEPADPGADDGNVHLSLPRYCE